MHPLRIVVPLVPRPTPSTGRHMRRHFLVTTTALASAFALGCGDRESPTAPTETLVPSFAATVERDTGPFPFGAFGFSDESHTLIFGAPFADLVAFCPGVVPTSDPFELLFNTRPDGSLHIVARGQDVNVVVFEEVNAPNCAELLDAPRYTGTVRVQYTDNDVFVSGNRAEASRIQITGTVTDESGQRYHLVAYSQFVVAPGTGALLNSNIEIKLTPIGG